MNTSHPWFAGLLALLLMASCNVPRYMENKTDRQYKRRGGTPQKAELSQSAIGYRMIGDAPDTLLLIHGFSPKPKLQWTEQLKPLGKEYTLLIPDLVHFGRSTSERNVYSVEFQADQLAELMDSLGMAKTHVLGLSYGGIVAGIFNTKYADRVKKLIISDSPLKYYSTTYGDSLAQQFGRESLQELLLPETGDDLRRLFKLTFADPPKLNDKVAAGIVDYYYQDRRTQKRQLLDYLYRNEQFLDQLYLKTENPVLLIWGANDLLIPLAVGKKLKQYFGENAQLTVISEAGHSPNIENHKAFNERVLAFLGQAAPEGRE